MTRRAALLIAGACSLMACEEKPEGPPPNRPGHLDCDGDYLNGKETDVRSNVDHCGHCGVKCAEVNGKTSCVEGECQPVCEAGFGACRQPRDGCEADLSSSSTDCGACGTACSETYCRQGKCEPSVHVAADLKDAAQIAFAVGEHIYARTSFLLPTSSVKLLHIPPGEAETLFTVKSLTPRGYVPIATNGQHFFGCKSPVLPLGSDCRLVRANLDGSAMKTLATVKNAHMHKIVVDQTHAYVARSVGVNQYAIASVPNDGGEVQERIQVGDLYSFAARDGALFWSLISPQGLHVLGKGEAKPRKLWDRSCGDLAVDGKHLYCAAGNELMRIELNRDGAKPDDGSSVQKIAVTPPGFHLSFQGVEVTEQHVYYGVSKATGLLDVRRVRKP